MEIGKKVNNVFSWKNERRTFKDLKINFQETPVEWVMGCWGKTTKFCFEEVNKILCYGLSMVEHVFKSSTLEAEAEAGSVLWV